MSCCEKTNENTAPDLNIFQLLLRQHTYIENSTDSETFLDLESVKI